MKYERLGHSGLTVSKLCFGGGSLGVGTLQPGKVKNFDQKGSNEVVARSIAAGITFFDTSDAYLFGEAETALGGALGVKRKDIVLATKCGLAWGPAQTNKGGLSARHIVQSCDESLRRLKTDWIDIYQSHSPDRITPMEETVRAFDQLIRAGKVRYAGICNYPAWKVAQYQALQDKLGCSRVLSNQVEYSMMGRGAERELVPLAKDSGLGVIVYQALAAGFLTGKYTRQNPRPEGGRRSNEEYDRRHAIDRERGYDLIEALQEIAPRYKATVAQITLAWTMSRPNINSVIFGVSKLEQLDENVKSADINLSEEDTARIDKLTALEASRRGE